MQSHPIDNKPLGQDDFPDDTPACDLPATTPAELETYKARADRYWSPAESRRRRFIRARQILAEFGEAEPSVAESELGELTPQPAPPPDGRPDVDVWVETNQRKRNQR